ncbi:hypothetical protein SK128_023425, partial [Halocaridina rubra]
MRDKVCTIASNKVCLLLTLVHSVTLEVVQMLPRIKRTRVVKRSKENPRSGEDGIRTSSEAPGSPRQTEDVTPVQGPFLPPPPVVRGRALTARDGRKELLRHLLRKKKPKKQPPLREPVVVRGRPLSFFEKMMVIHL